MQQQVRHCCLLSARFPSFGFFFSFIRYINTCLSPLLYFFPFFLTLLLGFYIVACGKGTATGVELGEYFASQAAHGHSCMKMFDSVCSPFCLSPLSLSLPLSLLSEPIWYALLFCTYIPAKGFYHSCATSWHRETAAKLGGLGSSAGAAVSAGLVRERTFASATVRSGSAGAAGSNNRLWYVYAAVLLQASCSSRKLSRTVAVLCTPSTPHTNLAQPSLSMPISHSRHSFSRELLKIQKDIEGLLKIDPATDLFSDRLEKVQCACVALRCDEQ